MEHRNVALTPPMGWNSWDAYGASVTEDEIRGNAEYMAAHMLPLAGNTLSAIFNGMSQALSTRRIGPLCPWKWMRIPDSFPRPIAFPLLPMVMAFGLWPTIFTAWGCGLGSICCAAFLVRRCIRIRRFWARLQLLGRLLTPSPSVPGTRICTA